MILLTFCIVFETSASEKLTPDPHLSSLCYDSQTGGSASVLLVLNGTIMGASGILSNTILNPFEQLKDPTNRWRYTYWASFAMTVNLFVNYLAPPSFMADNRSLDVDVPVSSTLAYLLGGFLVGAGTRIGNGCTTGTCLYIFVFFCVYVIWLSLQQMCRRVSSMDFVGKVDSPLSNLIIFTIFFFLCNGILLLLYSTIHFPTLSM